MNSLTYLSRQYDVLASARTPPSTPVTESLPLLPDQDSSERLKRVSTWSTKSFLIPALSGPPESWSLRRSYSSPAEVHETEQQPLPGPSTPHPARRPSTTSSRRPSAPSSRRPSVSSSEKGTRPKTCPENILRRVFFIRVLLSLWNYIFTLWRSHVRQNVKAKAPDVAVEEGTDEEEKDTEDEEKRSISLLDVQPPPPIPPPLSPGSTHTSFIHSPIAFSNSSSAVPKANSPIIIDSPSTVTITTVSRLGDTASRTPTPTLPTKKTPFHRPKTLVLDLDETLIHSTSRPMHSTSGGILSSVGISRKSKAGHTVEVVLGGRSTIYHVYKRPFVDYFLRKVSTWYTLVIFTASMQEYADPVIDWLDAGRGILGRRLFRESCTQLPNGSYTKDLTIVEPDLSLVCLVDNSPICYNVNEANGIPIEGWTHDPHDEALLDLLPVLDSLRFTGDVRRVLGIRGFS